jgi:TATA-binding protein-associated factor
VHHHIAQPPDKIIKNLCTFLCQDTAQTPTFAFTCSTTAGILSFQQPLPASASRVAPGKESKDAIDDSKADEMAKARLARRGAGLAFEKLSCKFGRDLFEVLPKMWQSMAGGLLSACSVGKPCVCILVDVTLKVPRVCRDASGGGRSHH